VEQEKEASEVDQWWLLRERFRAAEVLAGHGTGRLSPFWSCKEACKKLRAAL